MKDELSEDDLLAVEFSDILWDFYLLKQPVLESESILENMASPRFRQTTATECTSVIPLPW